MGEWRDLTDDRLIELFKLIETPPPRPNQPRAQGPKAAVARHPSRRRPRGGWRRSRDWRAAQCAEAPGPRGRGPLSGAGGGQAASEGSG